MPEVSVILPVYNGARTVMRAVRSILDQTLRDIELIVVDDGSADHTPAILRQIDDPRLKLIECPHRGVAATAHTAAEIARSPLLARMDADDFAYPRRLELQLRQLRQQQLDVVGCQVRIVDAAGRSAGSLRRYERWINEETMDEQSIVALRFVELPLVNPTILARREYFETGCCDEDVPEDYDQMLRGAARGMRFGKVGEILFDWTDHPGRLTRTDQRYSTDAFMRCRRSHLLAGPLEGRDRVDLWGFGQTGKPWLRWFQSRNVTVRHGFDVSERKVNERIHGVRVMRPSEMPLADGLPLIIAVGAEQARPLILPHIVSRGYVPGVDAWFVA